MHWRGCWLYCTGEGVCYITLVEGVGYTALGDGVGYTALVDKFRFVSFCCDVTILVSDSAAFFVARHADVTAFVIVSKNC